MSVKRICSCVITAIFMFLPLVLSATVTPASEAGGTANSDLAQLAVVVPTLPGSFVGVTPCRVVDTRGNGFGGQYGPPSLTNGNPRTFVMAGQCGVPANAQAIVVNLTVILPSAQGFLTAFPAGGTVPLASSANYSAGQVVNNAALIALGDGSGITVFTGGANADLVIDIAGYFAPTPAGQKICTVFSHVGDWRETISVPSAWTAAQCNAYRLQTVPSGAQYQLGCVYDSGIALGAFDGGLPSPNCGW